MPLEGINLQFAQITAVDTEKKTITAQTRLDGLTIYNIPLDSPLHRQFIPVVGQQVLLIREGEYSTRILAEFGERVFDAPINPGELLAEGSGGGMVYLNQSGDAMVADSTMSNVLKFISSVGIEFIGDALSIDIKGIGKFKIMEDKIELIKVTGRDEEVTSKVTMTDEKVTVESERVELGNNPSGGIVYSLSNVPGNHSFDIVTGRPIPSSQSTKTSP